MVQEMVMGRMISVRRTKDAIDVKDNLGHRVFFLSLKGVYPIYRTHFFTSGRVKLLETITPYFTLEKHWLQTGEHKKTVLKYHFWTEIKEGESYKVEKAKPIHTSLHRHYWAVFARDRHKVDQRVLWKNLKA